MSLEFEGRARNFQFSLKRFRGCGGRGGGLRGRAFNSLLRDSGEEGEEEVAADATPGPELSILS